MSLEALIAGIHEQKAKLINVLGVVQCMQSAVRDDEPPMELEGAIELLGEEVQRVINRLEELWSSARSDRAGAQP
jgi:hypothetical protein